MSHENQNMVSGLDPLDVLVSWPASDEALQAMTKTPDLHDFSADPIRPNDDAPLDQGLND